MRQPTFWFLFPLLLAASLLRSAGADKARRRERAFSSHSHDVAAVRTFPTAKVEETPSSNLRGSQRILNDDSTYGRQSSYYNNGSSSSSSSSNQASSSSSSNGSSSGSSSNQASSSSSGNSDSSSNHSSTYQAYINCDSSSGEACTSSNNSQEYEEINEGLSAWEAGMLSGALTLVAALIFMICCCGCSPYDIFGCAMCNRSTLFDVFNRNKEESPLSVTFADEQVGEF
jgi:hypothetical protein